MAVTQAHRILYLHTPLGGDTLVLSSFSGTEGMSQLFNYQLLMLSEEEAIAARDIVGKNITWYIQAKDNPPRFFNGFVKRFAAGNINDRHLRAYRAEVVPWLWFLTQTANCRIFQKKSVPEIIQTIFDDLGFSDYDLQLRGSYPKREYCVQYRETAFNFVSRLMEEEGIFYFFRHDDGQHTLVLADQLSSYMDVPDNQVKYGWRSLGGSYLETWERQFEFHSGKWARTDYNFETPSTNLLTTTNTVTSLPNIGNYEMFDYPGDYQVKGDGAAGTKVRMQEEEASYEVATGTGPCYTFTPGGKFTLEEHNVESEAGKAYVVTYIQHSAVDADFETSDRKTAYRNMFHCIPASATFRPGRHTPKPLVAGAQTALVVGPAGEEIYTDKYGRVKVQFYWDREGKKDENSSCWIRVAENWAGKNWGIVFNPRIGQEVIVEFLEGDPDRPIITGRVYNAEQMPPYELPANQTQSVIKTRSSKGGGTDNFNELRFEDKKGSEEIYFHAEKDFNRVVENNDTLKVGKQKQSNGDQTIAIFNNQKVTIGDPQAADGSQTTDIYKDRTATLQTGNDTLTIKMGNQTTTLNLGASSTEAMQSIELKVGQSSIKIDQMGVTIQGMLIKVQGQIQTQVQGTITQINGDAMTQIQGGITMIG